MKDAFRRLVSIRTVKNVEPIEGADMVEKVTVDNWNLVCAKTSGFEPGSKGVYFEIDTLLNQDFPAFEEFAAGGVKAQAYSENGQTKQMTGHVLKIRKIRGVQSYGLFLPLSVFGFTGDETQEQVDEFFHDWIIKYEPIILDKNAVGPFPSHLRKTDSERVQNISDEFLASLDKSEWVATEKIDGTSCTIWRDLDGEYHIASRNLEMRFDGATQLVLENVRARLEPGDFVQGELVGPGTNGVMNKLGFTVPTLLVFEASHLDRFEDMRVPVLDLVLPSTGAEALAQVDGLKSSINPERLAEGIVWWNVKGTCYRELGDRPNFKAINGKFLLKQK